MLGYLADKELTSLLWSGTNIVPVGTTEDERLAYADFLMARPRYSTSLVGPVDQVLDLADKLAEGWGKPAEIRENQPSMVATQSIFETDPHLRVASVTDAPLVVPASIAMFKEEVGYDPTDYGPGYVSRVFELCRAGHTFVRMGTGPDGAKRVEFKADIGALALGVAQIQGVWTAPDVRGTGIASRCMASVVQLVTATIAPTVSLYVNHYNHSALRVYDKVGFTQAGTFATVLY